MQEKFPVFKKKKLRIQKILSSRGYCSRRKAEELIKEGRVKIDGKIATIGDSAREDAGIYIDSKPVGKESKVYLLFNKPLGCVCALRDKKFKTVTDYIKLKQRLFPVGRLDYNTSGLLLLTNDGDFANRIMHPRYEILKTYLVKTNRPVGPKEIARIKGGIYLEDGKTSGLEVKQHSMHLLEVGTHEGRNRIIRRIFDKLGFRVESLKRIRIGNLEIGNLKPAAYRHLREEEKTRIFA
ncbi:MAG: rRNA pseudouridine synthase [Candidatus Omnitrophica bacterium]|nr:rRNA pseudouridine synthase [Candidatus Omnitrophota bacterium]